MPLFDDEDPRVAAALAELEKTRMWPFDAAKDRPLLTDLAAEFPNVDLAEEIRQWRVWMLDHPETKRTVRHRARLRSWCKKAVEFGQRPGDAGPRRGARPASAEEHGSTSDRLEGW